jgi:hypothetical protein
VLVREAFLEERRRARVDCDLREVEEVEPELLGQRDRHGARADDPLLDEELAEPLAG